MYKKRLVEDEEEAPAKRRKGAAFLVDDVRAMPHKSPIFLFPPVAGAVRKKKREKKHPSSCCCVCVCGKKAHG